MNNAEQKIGYEFKNPELLIRALTHSSYANERRTKSNERLEFLGDSVLSIIISKKLFKTLPEENEGVLSKTRSNLVCEHELAKVSEKIELGSLILLGRGEEMTGGRTRASVVSDAFEAVLAAIYLDSGMEAAEAWLMSVMEEDIEAAVYGRQAVTDYKTTLQEIVQRNGRAAVVYKLLSETGLDHDKHFKVCAVVDGVEMEQGEGNNKKDAEQNAAKKTLELHFNEEL